MGVCIMCVSLTILTACIPCTYTHKYNDCKVHVRLCNCTSACLKRRSLHLPASGWTCCETILLISVVVNLNVSDLFYSNLILCDATYTKKYNIISIH